MTKRKQLTRQAATLVAAFALGAGAAGFVAACGDDDDADKAGTAAEEASSTASSVSSTVQDAADKAEDAASTVEDATGNGS
jgi:hypothetical protein